MGARPTFPPPDADVASDIYDGYPASPLVPQQLMPKPPASAGQPRPSGQRQPGMYVDAAGMMYALRADGTESQHVPAQEFSKMLQQGRVSQTGAPMPPGSSPDVTRGMPQPPPMPSAPVTLDQVQQLPFMQQRSMVSALNHASTQPTPPVPPPQMQPPGPPAGPPAGQPLVAGMAPPRGSEMKDAFSGKPNLSKQEAMIKALRNRATEGDLLSPED